MDTLSHGLYGGIAVGRRSKKDYAIAFLFGVLPDLLSFGPLFVLSFLGLHEFHRTPEGIPDAASIPHFVYAAYDVTHSLVVYAVVVGLLYVVSKKKHLAFLTLGWPLHILVDIPTHSHQFFPTPFLWPFSSYSFNGISWSAPIIFIPNVILLMALYSYWFIKSSSQKTLQ